MSENKRVSPPWTDPDDAPDVSQVEAHKITWHVAEREVPAAQGLAALQAAARRGRPKSLQHKAPVTLRLDADTLARWRASGKGWQTRAALVLAAAAPETETSEEGTA